MDTYFTFEYDEKLFDAEISSKAEAIKFTDEWWWDFNYDSGELFFDDEIVEDKAFIVEFYRNDDNEFVEVGREEFWMSFHYTKKDRGYCNG